MPSDCNATVCSCACACVCVCVWERERVCVCVHVQVWTSLVTCRDSQNYCSIPSFLFVMVCSFQWRWFQWWRSRRSPCWLHVRLLQCWTGNTERQPACLSHHCCTLSGSHVWSWPWRRLASQTCDALMIFLTISWTCVSYWLLFAVLSVADCTCADKECIMSVLMSWVYSY